MHPFRLSPDPAPPADPPAPPADPPSPSLIADPPAPADPPPADPPAPTSFVGEDGKFAEGWAKHYGVSEEALASVGTFPSVKEMAESFFATKQMVGKKMERPTENASADDLAEYRKFVGAPENAEGYGDLKPEGVTDDMWNTEQAKEFTELAHRHNLTPEAARDLTALQLKLMESSEEDHQGKLEAYKAEQVADLRDTWKSDYDTQINAAKRFAATIGVDLNDPIFADAAVVKAFASGATMVSEDKLLKGDAVGLVASRKSRAIADMENPKNSRRSEEYHGLHGEQAQNRAAASVRADLKSGT